MRVLLVEDDADIGPSVRDGMLRHGYQIDVVGTGQAAPTVAGHEVTLGLP